MPAQVKPLFFIRRLNASDVHAYRALRLEALQHHPENFGSSLEEESAFEPEAWIERLESEAIFGGFLGAQLLGIASFVYERRAKLAHSGWLGGLYVQDAARGTGLSDQLIAAVLAHARREVEQVLLYVGAHNVAAKWLYARHGFTVFGRLPDSLRVGGRSYTDEMMVCRLAPLPAQAPGGADGGAPV